MMKLFSSWQGEVMLIVLLDHLPKERDGEREWERDRKRIRLLGCCDRATLGACWSLVFSYTCLYVWCVWLIWQDTSWAPQDAVGSITTFTSCRQAHLITKNVFLKTTNHSRALNHVLIFSEKWLVLPHVMFSIFLTNSSFFPISSNAIFRFYSILKEHTVGDTAVGKKKQYSIIYSII